MTIATHAIATIGIGKFLGINSFSDWFLAFLFGVFVDLDHLKILRPKHINNGDWRKFLTRELPVRSFLQEPISLLWVVPLSLYLDNPIPMAAWAVHVFLDYLVDGAKRPFWPISSFALKEGIFLANHFWEFLLIPLSVLVFILWR